MSLFTTKPCARCGQEVLEAELRAYKGKHYCPACLKTVKAANKVPCPHCQKKYSPRGLKSHVKRCKQNPANKQETKADGMTRACTSCGQAGILVEGLCGQCYARKRDQQEAEIRRQLLQERVELTRVKTRHHVDQQLQLQEEVTRLRTRVVELEMKLAGMEGPRSGIPRERPSRKSPGGRGLGFARHAPSRHPYPVHVTDHALFLEADPVALIEGTVLLRDEAATSQFRKVVSFGEPARVARFLADPAKTRQRVYWQDVLALALKSTSAWFASVHVFAVFLRCVERTVNHAVAELTGGKIPQVMPDKWLVDSFRRLLWRKIGAWPQSGLAVTWTDDALGREEELVVTEVLVASQNVPLTAAQWAVEARRVTGDPPELPPDPPRLLRRLGKKPYLHVTNPQDRKYREYCLQATFEGARWWPAKWPGASEARDNSPVHLATLPDLERAWRKQAGSGREP